MRSAGLIDAAVSGRVLVFGSTPPHGRDLDLLARPTEQGEIERVLNENGYLRRGNQWVRFDGCTTDAVDLVPAGDWELDAESSADLFDRSRPVEGYAHLVRPAPHHALLILARRVVRSGGELDPKKRARVRQALDEEPDAWALAQRIAGGWRARRAIVALERLYRTGVPTSRRARVAALVEVKPGSTLRAWRIVLKPKKGRGVIAFSGLDGSGKTSQAEALKDSLERTTGETVVVWTRLSYNPSLKVLAKPIKAIVGRRTVTGAERSTDVVSVDPGKELRRKSTVVTYAWATAVALANAASQRRMTRYHLRRGRNVVCDRYTLDSRVHLRYRYGKERTFGLQAWIIRALSPEPIRTYHVEVPPEVAYERKAEQYDLEQLRTQARLYEEERAASGVKRLDGTRPKEELCAEIAADVWLGLS